jgi:hypothetical protein
LSFLDLMEPADGEIDAEAEALAALEAEAEAKRIEEERIRREKEEEEKIVRRAKEKELERQREQEEFARQKAEEKAKKERSEKQRIEREAKELEKQEKARQAQIALEEKKKAMTLKLEREKAERLRIQGLIDAKNNYWARQAARKAPENLGTDLRHACRNNDFDTVKEIVDEWNGHASIEEEDIDGWNAVVMACKRGAMQCATYIMEKQWINEHWNALEKRKVWHKKFEKVTDEGQTILMFAAIGGNPELVEFIIKNGANVNAANEDGMTALHWAAYKGQAKVIKTLLAAPGMRYDMRTRGGQTPLEVALVRNDSKDTIELLQSLPTIED